MKEKTWYIYSHWTKDTNECFYIGVGTGDRIGSRASRNKYWKSIVKKHGYTSEIICDGFTCRDLAVKEEIRLQQLNRPRACFTYGDRLNSIVSEETRRKMSISGKGRSVSKETRDKIRKTLTGNKHSNETKDKISKIHKGNTHTLGHVLSDEHKEKLRNANLGKTLNKETIEKIRKIHIGRVDSKEVREKRAKANHKQVINCRGEVFDGMTTVKLTYKTATHIGCVCRGNRKYSGQYEDGTKIKWKWYV